MENIMLIGFMGTGKSTVASQLHTRLGMDEIDMDAYIVQKEKRAITEIFEKEGEEYFRKVETACLKEILEKNHQVVSCGGGAVIKQENVALMKEKGIIVLLTAQPETILKRVKNTTDRPILNGNMNVEFISQLMEKRRELYESVADIRIETDNKSVDKICSEIAEQIK